MNVQKAFPMRQCPFLGEEYGKSKHSTESNWFARGFRHSSGADSDLDTSRGGNLTETFFASRFGQVRDRFGTLWTIIHQRPM
jgi:hypothetical protein